MGQKQSIRNVTDQVLNVSTSVSNEIGQTCNSALGQTNRIDICAEGDVTVKGLVQKNISATNIECVAKQFNEADIDTKVKETILQAAENKIGALSNPLSTQEINNIVNLAVNMSAEIKSKAVQNCTPSAVQGNVLNICTAGEATANNVYVGFVRQENISNAFTQCLQDAAQSSNARQQLELELSQKASNKALGLFDGLIGFIIILVFVILIVVGVGGGIFGGMKKSVGKTNKAIGGALVVFGFLLIIYVVVAKSKGIWPFAPAIGKEKQGANPWIAGGGIIAVGAIMIIIGLVLIFHKPKTQVQEPVVQH